MGVLKLIAVVVLQCERPSGASAVSSRSARRKSGPNYFPVMASNPFWENKKVPFWILSFVSIDIGEHGLSSWPSRRIYHWPYGRVTRNPRTSFVIELRAHLHCKASDFLGDGKTDAFVTIYMFQNELARGFIYIPK